MFEAEPTTRCSGGTEVFLQEWRKGRCDAAGSWFGARSDDLTFFMLPERQNYIVADVEHSQGLTRVCEEDISMKNYSCSHSLAASLCCGDEQLLSGLSRSPDGHLIAVPSACIWHLEGVGRRFQHFTMLFARDVLVVPWCLLSCLSLPSNSTS